MSNSGQDTQGSSQLGSENLQAWRLWNISVQPDQHVGCSYGKKAFFLKSVVESVFSAL